MVNEKLVKEFIKVSIKREKLHNQLEEQFKKIASRVSGGGFVRVASADSNDINYESYFQGCGNDYYDFPTKLLYMTNEELNLYFGKEKKVKERKEKAEQKRWEKEEEAKEKRIYKRLKKKYETTN